MTNNGDDFVKEEDTPLQEIEAEEKGTEKVDFDLEAFGDSKQIDFGASDFGHGSDDVFARATELVSNVGTNSVLERLKTEIRVSEIELFLKKSELLKQQLLLALESSKASSGK